MPGEPLDQLRDQLDPGACRLENLPERIWLFGGKGSFRSDSQDPCESLRESFWRQSLNGPPSPGRRWVRDLAIPETYPDWWAFSGYDDLLTFERDACHLARAIILFPESPGSLAELGALAVDDAIIDRLLVVVQSKYLEADNRQSFLNLGPLKRAEDLGHRCVVGVRSTDALPTEDFDSVMEFIDSCLPHMRKTEKLRIDVSTHRLLLVADLVDLLLISRPAELQAALMHFGMRVTEPELERVTRLLEFFGLVRIEHRGTKPFFVRRERVDRTWVNYTARDGKPVFDRSRFKLDRRALMDSDRLLLSILERTT